MAPYVYVTIVIACLLLPTDLIEAKTVFRRRDKISENFKQLSQDEIDPNVAPVEPAKPVAASTEIAASVESSSPVLETGSEDAVNAAEEASDATIPSTAAAGNDGAAVDDTLNEVVEAEFIEQPEEVASTSVTTPKPSTTTTEANGLSKYCKCSDVSCDCCRSIGIPILPIRGPGCAKITYLGDEKMSVSLRYGDITLATRTISSKRARPVCVGLPGGYSKFCGRVYGLAKTKDNFKACLGFELRADDEVEAALRVSCFKFGPEGLRVADAEPLPSELNKDKEEEEDEGFFGFGAGGDDEDEEDYDEDDDDADGDDEYDDDTAAAAPSEAPEDADYGGFSLAGLFGDLDDESETTASKPVAVSPIISGGETRTTEEKATLRAKKVKGKGTKVTVAAPQDEKADEVTTADNPASEATPVKPDAVKTKTKKNKRKKTAAATETDLAYEILNGILDYFN